MRESISKGAKVAYGSLDYIPSDEALKDGAFVHPMILEDIPKDSPAYNEELFGPVFGFYKANSND